MIPGVVPNHSAATDQARQDQQARRASKGPPRAARYADPVKAADWSAIVAGVALVLGLVNLWYGVIRPLWRNRKASPAAQLDLLRYPKSGGKWEEEERIVVTDHGPALMRNVTVEVFDQDDGLMSEGFTTLWPKMPVEVLHVGQSLYLTLLRVAELEPRRAVIRWHDNRRGEKSHTVSLSYHRVV